MKVEVYKAQPSGRPTEDMEIVARETMPDLLKSIHPANVLKVAERQYRAQAEKIVDALDASLPGGTLHQVLVLMLERKVDLLRVRDREPVESPEVGP